MVGPNTDKNDPFEEFEFRPINEGLGFHRKSKGNPAGATSFATAGASTSASTIAPISPKPKTTLTKTTASAVQTMTTETPSPFKSPLPRQEQTKKPAMQVPLIEDDSIAKAQSAVNDILKSLNQKRQIDFAAETEKQRLQLKKSKPQLFAAVLDGMLIVAAFLMTLILMLTVTKVDMILNLTHPSTSGFVYSATLLLFASVAFIYMVVNRTFLGHTPGEWAFDQQCGDESEQAQWSYIPKVMLRSLIVILTGFVITPFLSFLMNKDIAGDLAGVHLFKKPTGL